MKNSSTIRPVGICAALLTAGLLTACGGGGAGAASDSAGVTGSTGTAPGVTSSETVNATPGTPAADVTIPPVLNSALSTSQYAEAMGMSDDAKATSAALVNVGSTIVAAGSSTTAGSTVVDSTLVDFATAFLSESGASTSVGTLAAVGNVGRYVKFSDEGHSFTVPANSAIRFGDPLTNRWVTKTVSGYGECTNQFFGNDPASGTLKVCQAWASTAGMVALSVGPVWSPKPVGKMPAVDLTKIPTPWVGFTGERLQATDEQAPGADIGQFRTSCGVAKLSFDDPIVFPGQVGKAHLHTFFGNTGVNASSTPDSLRTTGATTCRGGTVNRSAYWVPTLIDTRTGTPLIPTGNGVYYKTGYDLPTSVIRPIPAGLRMIAGTAGATTPGSAGYRFKCVGGPNNENDKYGSEIGNCDAGASLIQEIFFPQCWDGVNLDSPDHKSHMAYPNNFKCPADHPVAIPAITFNVEYVVSSKNDPLSWRLSSDNYDTKLPGGYSSHGDWFNGWESSVSDAWAKGCVQAVKDCHSHLLGDGRMIY